MQRTFLANTTVMALQEEEQAMVTHHLFILHIALALLHRLMILVA